MELAVPPSRSPQAAAESTGRRGRLYVPSAGWIAGLLAMATVALIGDAVFRARGELDYDLIRTIRRIDHPIAENLFRSVSWLTGSEPTIALWFGLVVVFLATRRWLAALVLMAFPLAGGLNWLIRDLVGRARPDPQEIGGALGGEFFRNDWESFPSGHVVGAVLLYGFLFLLAGRLPNRYARLAGRAGCVAVIAVSGPARVWLGHHWVGDVVAAYAFGGLVLTGVVVVYRSMAPTMTGIPLVHAAPVAIDEGLPHAHALTSTLQFRDGKVFKTYNPGFVPRLAYWLSFQAPFAYAHNEHALEAAVLRRNLAGMLTEYWYGTRRVSPAYGITTVNGRLTLVGQYTEGSEPADHRAGRAFLFDLAERFDAAGLPTWQIDPRQPRSLGNILEVRPGEYTVIDLESGMVSPLQSPRAWFRAIRRAQVPLYDDVFFDITRAYVARESEAIRAKKGETWLLELESLLGQAEDAANRWHGEEPRLWSRFLRAAASGFAVRTFPGWIREKARKGQERAGQWINDEIDRWVDEGRFTADEAARARAQLEDTGVQAVLPHFGVHLLIGVALRFPLGSIARVLYVSGNLGVATARLLFRRISRREWLRQFGIHSPLVVLIAALPGIGTFSYLASWPLLRNHAILRVALDAVGEKLPWRVYRKVGLRRIVARPVRVPVEVQS